MGMEAPVQYGGSNFSFISTILAIEEIAKVDASVALVVDTHNTLILKLFKILGTTQQKEKYLPLLATKEVSNHYTPIFLQ
jgi:alkylation response protein AidB-like acyl-CoA dehydrogenase